MIIGDYKNYENLSINHYSGLDIRNKKKKIIIELKNRYNTDNNSSRKQNFLKLSEYKKKHPNYKCIYGVINDKQEDGKYYKFIFNNQELIYMSGNILLEYIFKANTGKIIEIIQDICCN
jgi:hypothetical protein